MRSRLAAATAVVVADGMAGANLNTRLGVGRSLASHALLNLARHGQESLLDVARVLGRGLEERDAEAVGELLQKRSVTMLQVARYSPFGGLTFATVYSTTFLSAISLLLPTSSLLTPSVA